MGHGPPTGRGFGPCGRGYGYGRGRGRGAGFGRGYGRRAGGRAPEYGPYSRGYAPEPPSKEEEIRLLKEELRELEAERKEIGEKLAALEGGKKKG